MKYAQLALATALAAAGAFATQASASIEAGLPAVKMQGPVSYLTGGIGSDEAAAMKHAESKYPLSMMFVEHRKPRDEYLAAVAVTITDSKGKAELTTLSDGPFLLADLPDGKYTVSAVYDGKTLKEHATVAAGKPRQLVFAW